MKKSRNVSRNSDEEEIKDDGLSGGQITGIVLLSIGGLGLLVCIILLIINQQKNKKKLSFMRFQDFIRNY